MSLTAAGRTNTGTVRPSNQDAINWHIDNDADCALLVVADGMGGYLGGEVASQIAVDTLMELLMPKLDQSVSEADRKDSIQGALALASDRIGQRKAEDPSLEKMGTTVVVAWLCGQSCVVAHLGDSRCYQIHGGTLTCLTRDDTVVQNMLEDGSIREADVPNVPFRNVLTRALGSSEATATFGDVELVEGESLLLCTDGLTEALDEAQWLPLLEQAPTLDSGVQSLLEACLEHGAKDNVSVVLLSKH